MLCSKCQEAIWSLLMYTQESLQRERASQLRMEALFHEYPPLLDIITLDFYLFLLLARKDSLALRPDQYCTSMCEETPSAIKIWKLSGVPWASKAHILYLWVLTPFVLFPLIFSLSFQCLSSFHDHSGMVSISSPVLKRLVPSTTAANLG